MAISFPGITYADPTGNFYAAGRWMFASAEFSGDLYNILFGSAPAVQGSYSVNLGFRSEDFSMRVLYVAASQDAVQAMWRTDKKLLVGPVDGTISGASLKRCFMDATASRNTPIEKIVNSDAATVFMMYANIKMSSKGESQ